MYGTTASKRRVLIIDDNAAIHDDFRKILVATADDGLDDLELSLFGDNRDADMPSFEVEFALQGQEGLEKLTAAREAGVAFDVAFVDMRMPPGWDGVETIEHLWKADPDLQIVICTAYSDYTWSEIVSRLGHSDNLLILKKPFDSVEVCQLATALTAKRELTRQAQLKMEDLELMVEQRTKELKQREEQLRHKQKLEAVGALASGVAHEFNNALQAVQGYCSFAVQDLPADSKPREDVGKALAAAQGAAQISKQLLDFSRRSPASREPAAIDKITERALDLLRPLLPPQVQLQANIADDLPEIMGDTRMLEQVIVNLCINARDAMSGDGQLTVNTERVEIPDRRGRTRLGPDLPPGAYARISVSDTGCGISEEVLERIFDPFFTTKPVGQGTGLGLAMVHGAIEQHDGAITVDSEPGEGTTFRLYVPFLKTPADDLEEAQDHSAGSDAQRSLASNDAEQIQDAPTATAT